MQVFNRSMEWIDQAIYDGLYQLREFSGVERAIDLYSTISLLNFVDVQFDKKLFQQKVGELSSSSSFRRGIHKIEKFERREIKNIEKNYLTNCFLPYHFFSSIEKTSIAKSSFIPISEKEVYAILKDYYGEDSSYFKLFDQLILEQGIYEIPSFLKRNIHASISSTVLPGDAIFLSDSHSLSALTDLVFELSYIMEQKRMKNLAEKNENRYCNDYLLMKPSLDKKAFLEYLKKEVLTEEEVESIYLNDLHTLIDHLEQLQDFMKTICSKNFVDYGYMIPLVQTIYGEVFSNILFTKDSSVLLEFEDYINAKKRKLYELDDLLGFGLTVSGASSYTTRQYQKNIRSL